MAQFLTFQQVNSAQASKRVSGTRLSKVFHTENFFPSPSPGVPIWAELINMNETKRLKLNSGLKD